MTREEFNNLEWLPAGPFLKSSDMFVTEKYLSSGYPFLKIVGREREKAETFIGYSCTLQTLGYGMRAFGEDQIDELLGMYEKSLKDRAELWWNKKYGKKE
jgi:hypothetical protein